MPREHRISDEDTHHVWDNSLPPAVTIDPGDTVRCTVTEGSCGQMWPGAPAAQLAALDLAGCYPLAGPIHVNKPSPATSWRSTCSSWRRRRGDGPASRPGFGLLGDDFDEPYVRYFELGTTARTVLCDGVTIPIQPFLGTMGVAPDGAGALPVLPPTKGAGNVDTRHLTVGSTLELPVFVPGALLSLGDAHAAQGDGEVCGTTIECGMDVVVRIDLAEDVHPVAPWTYRFTTPPAPRNRHPTVPATWASPPSTTI